MNASTKISAVLWDFGDTLADERWMQARMQGVPSWPSSYVDRLGRTDLGDRGNSGAVSARQVAAEIGQDLGLTQAQVLEHMEQCSRNISFFPRVMQLVWRCSMPQAIVTINPDIFSSVVVPTYRLTETFDLIVTSWEQQILDKARLCEIAVSMLSRRRAECLLIDNKLENVAAWRASGGAAYHFESEAKLCDQMVDVLV